MANQLNLFGASEREGGGNGKNSSGKPSSLNPPLAPAFEALGMWVGSYRAIRGGHYFRFYWQQPIPGRPSKTRYIHIPGGNSTNLRAIANREKVEAAIAVGKSLEEIKCLIHGFEKEKGNYKREIQPV